MTAQNEIQLREQLKKLEFEEAFGWFDVLRQTNERSFNVFISKDVDDDKVNFVLHFEKAADEVCSLRNYDITIRHIEIPNMNIAGVNTSELESRMQQADEMYNQYYTDPQKVTMRESKLVESIKNDIDKLIDDGSIGKETAHMLLFKYWPEGEYSRYLVKGGEMELKYESTLRVDAFHGEFPTASDAYYQLKGMHREHVLSDEVFAQAKVEFAEGNHWVAYNGMNYFIDKGDAYFFKDEESAREFAANNISDDDSYNVIHCQSPDELLRKIPYGEQLRFQLINNKSLTMNQDNYSFLKDNIRNHGFGDTLQAQLEEQMKKGVAEFTLVHKTEVNKKEIEATLYFKKSDKSDFYFFNKYDAKCQSESNKSMSQTFYLNNNWGVTLKEAYNLLNGRAVHKELTNKEDQKYKAWIQLDFSKKDANGNYERKQYHENYGYDLKEALSYYPIKEMIGAGDKENLIRSLERGNVQMVTLEVPGKDVKVFIEANPQYKSVQLYSNDMKRLDQGQREEMMKKPEMKQEAGQGQDQSKEQSKDVKKTIKKDDDLDGSKKKSRKKSMGV